MTILPHEQLTIAFDQLGGCLRPLWEAGPPPADAVAVTAVAPTAVAAVATTAVAVVAATAIAVAITAPAVVVPTATVAAAPFSFYGF